MMESFSKLCTVYEEVMAGKSLTVLNVNDILHILSDEMVFLETKKQPQQCTKDTILLSFSILSQSMTKHQWSDEAAGLIVNSKSFELFSKFLDCEEMLLSYSCSKAIGLVIKNLFSFGCLQIHIDSVLNQLCKDRQLSANGWIHRLDLLTDLVSHSSKPEENDYKLEVSVTILVVSRWQELLTVLFNQQSALQQHAKYSNIVFSLCCLWNKLLKCCLLNVSSTNTSLNLLLTLNEILLQQIECGLIPAICRSNCLSVLLHSVTPGYSMQAESPACVVKAAQCNLKALFDWSQMRQWVFHMFSSQCQTDEHSTVINTDADSICNGSGETVISHLEPVHRYQHVAETAFENRFLYCSGSRRHTDKIRRKILLLALRSMTVVVYSENTAENISELRRMLKAVGACLGDFAPANTKDLNCFIIDLFSEQDDCLFEVLLCLLDIHSRCSSDSGTACSISADGVKLFEPCFLFLNFLETIGWDHMVLLDFVTSPETCCLTYLTRLIQFIVKDWLSWESACNSCRSSKLHLRENISNYSATLIGSGSRKRKLSVHDSSSTDYLIGNGDINAARICKTSINKESADAKDSECDEQSEYYMKLSKSAAEMVNFHSTDVHNCLELTSNLADVKPKKFSTAKLVSYSSSSSDGSSVNDSNNSDCSTSSLGCASISLNCGSSDEVQNDNVMDDAMSALIRFRIAVERLVRNQLFPYNIKHLLALLERCEYLYDAT